jgi:predicted DNA-binding antitoxin AbrB/MazE fold protein
MSIQIEAVYENGVLKLDHPLPLENQARVVVTIQPKSGRAMQSYGLLKWSGTTKDLDELLSAENRPWGEVE